MPRRGGRRKPTSTASSHDIRWVMLDRLVHLDKAELDEFVAAADGTQSGICNTCTGTPLIVSVRVAMPPAVSRLYLCWPDGLRPEMSRVNPPSIIAAHGHSILFQARVPHIEHHRPEYYPIDYFVYTACRSPSLTRLPPCFKGGRVDQETDQFFLPYRLQQQRRMHRSNIGLLCRGDEEFTVAELSSRGELCLLHHPPGEGDEAKDWDIETLQMPYGEGVPEFFGPSWKTDVVIPFGGSYLCWVDYYLGLLFVSVHGEVTKKSYYIPMPASLDSHRLYIDAGAPDLARRVCVTDSGTIKLICISDKAGRSLHKPCHLNFKITSWNLVNKKWIGDSTMQASKFWAVLDVDRRLPHLRPEFPTISLVDPDVVCFVLNEDYRIYWLIEVNMKNMVLGQVTLYISDDEEGCSVEISHSHGNINEEEEEGCSVNMTRRTYLEGSFIPSHFTRYLHKDLIRSLAFSKKLEMDKLKQAKENGLIKSPSEGPV